MEKNIDAVPSAEDRVHILGAELCELLATQLELLDPEKISSLTEAEMLAYEQRRGRIAVLVRELTGVTLAGKAA